MGPETHEIVELEAMAVLGVCGMVTCGRSRRGPMCVSRVPLMTGGARKVMAGSMPRGSQDRVTTTTSRLPCGTS